MKTLYPPRGLFRRTLVLVSCFDLVLSGSALAQNCELYPIALSSQTLSNAAPGTVLNIYNGTQPGSFGWLSWGGSPSEPTLVTSLTPTGDSSTYVNPDDPNDHRLVVGDWVSSKPGVSNSKNVRDALNSLETIDITVPVWSQSRGQGANAAYRVSAFAVVRILSYQLPGQNQITAQFVGYANCGVTNEPPVVNAGPDQTITLPATASLNGLITDDGLPSGAQLTASWSEVSGPGTVTFSNPTLTSPLNGTPITNQFPTTVTFPAAGTYVLQLTASDSQYTSSNNVVITVDRPETPPIADSQSVTLAENTSTNIVLQGSDPDGDPISFIVVTLPNYGTLSGTPPNLTYTPKADFNGQDSFTFETYDGLLYSSNATISITITPVIVPPVADAESYTNDENSSLPITLSGSDVQGLSLTFQILTGPTNGTLSGTPPNVIYNPTSNYFGPDAFTFQDNNGVTNSAPALISITVLPVDEPPLVEAGPDQLIVWPTNTVNLAGEVTYWAFPGTVDTVQWTEVSGPGTVVFANPSNEVTTATFSQSGLYVLQLMASDSFLSGTDALAVTVDMPPTVSAGPNQTNTLPNTITLYGTASDDGLPTNGVLTVAWSFVSGPGSVVFANPNQTNTTVSFSQSGIYDLRLTANDGAASTSSDVIVVANQTPIVDAGSDQIVTNLQAALHGTVFDDGLPNGTLLINWTELSGPGVATFANSTNPATTVTFSQPGVYVLQLTANDSLAQSSAEVTITVDSAPVVGVSGDTIITLPATDPLTATVTDSNLPAGFTLSYQWTQVSGPGTVSFSAATALATTASFSTDGVYVIQFAASDSLLTSTTNITVIANLAPIVSAGPAQLITLPQNATLNGTATDDGLPYGTLTTTWTQISGPGTVTFANPNSASTTASFSSSGIYVLQLTASDGVASNSATVTITANQAPVVFAGPNQIITWPSNQVVLAGSATDDGLPYGTLTTTWTSVSGPGTVTFGNPSVTNTTATFSAPGLYVLQLAANDGAASTTAQVTIILNQPPVVNAGPYQTILWPSNQVTLNAVATDDGLPYGTLTATWSEVSGPGTVAFANPAATNTTATFSAPGLYVLSLSASDGSASGSATTTITVDQAPTVTLPGQFLINWPSNQLTLNGMVTDDGLPVGGVLTQVWTQTNGPGTIGFVPAVQTNALAGTPITNSLSTTATVSAPGLYHIQLTADDGIGTNQTEAVVIVNQPPTVNAGPAEIVAFPNTVTLNGVATDDGLPYGTLTTTWSQVSGPGTVTFSASAATNSTATFSAPGVYLLQLSANDGAATSSATVTITVDQGPAVTLATPGLIGWPTNSLTLNGTVIDAEGLPVGGTLVWTWSQVSGPGTVSFAPLTQSNALTGLAISNAVLTTATFSAPGNYVVELSASDGIVSNSATATVKVDATPVAFPQSISTVESQSVSIALQGASLLNNPLNFAVATGPAKGTLSGTPPNVIYQPNAGFFGSDSFTFIATDGTLSSFPATVSINVTPLPRSKTYATDADFLEGQFFKELEVTNNELMLRSQGAAFHYVWVAVSSKGTIVRIDTTTGQIMGEYKSAPDGQPLNPSRTTVDMDGSVWCANRNGDSVVHIVVPESGLWQDRNSNGVVDTSTNLGDVRPWPNTNGVDSNGGVSSAQDECIIHYVKVRSYGTRHVSVDTNNNVWVSGIGGRYWDYINGVTGQITRQEPSVGIGGYGGLIDHNGVIWSSTSGSLLRWDTSNSLTNGNWTNINIGIYGLGLDSQGNVWASTLGAGKVYKLAADGTVLGVFNQGNPYAQGIAAGLDDDIWVAHSLWGNTVGHLKNDGTFVGNVQVGNGPTGVAVDSNGKIWVAHYSSGNVMRIDPSLGPVGADGRTPIGQVDFISPYLGGNCYNYSDMTGSTLTSFRGPGSWTVVFDSTIPQAAWGPVTWNSKIYDDGALQVVFSTSSDGTNFGPGQLLPLPNTVPTVTGRYAKLQVTFVRSYTGEGPILDNITLGTAGYNAQLVQPTVSVSAGPDHQVQLPLADQLHASVVHNGFLTFNTNQTFTWSAVSGPGTVSFGNSNAATTSAQYSTQGVYVVRTQTSLDGTTYSDDAQVTAIPINHSPWVDLGPNRVLRSTNDTLQLAATATDDGYPNGILNVFWSKVIGPGTVTFSNPTESTNGINYSNPFTATNNITFSAPGLYVLQLAASDGQLGYTNQMEVRVQDVCSVEPPSGISQWWPGNASTHETVRGNDMYLEQGAGYAPGQISYGFSFNGTTNYAMAYAHPALDIGSAGGMTIEFWAKASSSGRFFDWYRNGVYGPYADYTTSGNTVTFHLRDTNNLDHSFSVGNVLSTSQFQHVALTYDQPSGMVLVYVNGIIVYANNLGSFTPLTSLDFYLAGGPQDSSHFGGIVDELTMYTRALTGDEIYQIYSANFVGKCPIDNDLPPVVDAGGPVTLPAPGSVTLTGSVTEANLPLGINTLYSEWRTLSGPTNVVFGNSNNPVTTATFPLSGIYTLQLYADDAEKSATDQADDRVDTLCSVKNIPGLVGWWTGNYTTADAMGGNAASRVNGTSYAPGEVGAAFNLNGVNNYLVVPQSPAYDLGSSTNGFTIEFWEKAGFYGGNRSVLGWNNGTANGLYLYQNNSSIYAVMVPTNGSSVQVNGPVCFDGNWHHVAFTYDPVLGEARFYVDGVLLTIQSVGAITCQTTYDLYFGQNVGQPPFGGELDEISLYQRPLNPQEVDSIYASGSVGKCPNDSASAPVVSAGPNLFLTDVPATGMLVGSVTDSNLPVDATLSVQWTMVSGPGAVTFSNANSAVTSASFAAAGTYVLQLTANNSEIQASATVEVRVQSFCTTEPKGIVAWWPAEDNALDVIGGQYGVLGSGTSFTTGEVGMAFNFNGAHNFVWVPAQTNYNIGASTNGFTIEFWEKAGFYGGDRSILGWNNGISVNGLYLFQNNSSIYAMMIPTNGSGVQVNGPVCFDGNWHHVAFTYDPVLQLARFYVDGVLLTTQNVGTITCQTTYDLYFGQVVDQPPFGGQLDEISLYLRPLNPQEVNSIFASGSVGKCPDDGNQPPSVYAGPDLFVESVPGTATLEGQVSDDGLPAGATLQIQWSQVSGPGTVTFSNATAAVTTAAFSTNGIYVLQLTANNGEAQSSDLVEVRVESPCTVQDPSGLTAWWPANGTAEDVIGGQVGVLGSGTSFTTGEVGMAFNFNGTHNFVWLPAQTNYNIGASTNGFTIEFWVNTGFYGGSRSILGWNNSTTLNGLYLFQNNSSIYAMMISTNGSSVQVNGPSFFDGNWHHVAFTYDDVLGLARFYVDGVLLSTQNVGVITCQTAYDLYFGQVVGLPPFGGELDEISLYRRPLNPQEVNSIYASGSVGKCPDDGNQPPSVYAGPDLYIQSVPGTATLEGEVSDESMPAGATLQIQWSKVSGPGTVTFGNAAMATTTATFSTNGIYVLQLTANNGEAQSSDLVEVRVETLCTVQDPAGLSAWWPANGTALDVIGGQVGVLGSGTSFTTGEVGMAFNFNGTHNFVWLPAQTNYNIGASTNGFTIEFWVNTGFYGGSRSILGWNNSTTLNGLYLFQNNSSIYAMMISTNGSSVQVNGPSFFDGNWHHVAFTYDDVLGLARFYVDGVLLSTQNVGAINCQTTYDLYFGQVVGLPPFGGDLDEISLYQRPLNPQEVYSIYASGSVGKCPDDGNQPPLVYAGPDLIVPVAPGSAVLNGRVTDDGLPVGSTLQILWSKVSGPGTVTFSNATTVVTTATFSTNGIYLLQLTANDGEAQSSSLVEVRVENLCTLQDPSGLSAWWPADGTAQDVIGGQYGILGSGTTFTTGEVGMAFNFNGAHNFVWLPAQTNYNIGNSTNGFTIEFWEKAGFYGGSRSILGWNNSTTLNGLYLFQNNSSIYAMMIPTNGSSVQVNGPTCFDGNWHHVAFTYDEVLGQARFYVDGALLTVQNVGTLACQTAYDLYFGQVVNLPPFGGVLDEISLYQRPLNPQEVYSIYASGSVGKCPNDGNQPPFVYAGPDSSLPSVTNIASLNGFVSDDGLPLQILWTNYSGPGTVMFADPSNPVTTATFTTNGLYVLELTANDSEAQASGYTEVRVGIPCTISDIPNLVGWWPANGTPVDRITGVPAILGSGTTYVPGKVATAFNFDGVHDFVWVPEQTNYNIGSSSSGFTIEFWVRTGFYGGNRSILGWNNGSVNGLYLYQNNSSIYAVMVPTNGSSVQVNGPGVFDGNWHHVAFTYDEVAGQAKFYEDGVLSATQNVGAITCQTAYDLYFGQIAGQPPFGGQLDEISIYTRPLAQTEIQSIVAAGSSGKCISARNQPPIVSAGASKTVYLTPNPVTLYGAAVDDGLPSNTLSVAWSYLAGPSPVIFGSTNTPVTTVTFTNVGSYTFQISAFDGQYTSVATATITVVPNPAVPPTVSFSTPVNGSSMRVHAAGTNLTLAVTAADSYDGIASVQLFENGVSLTNFSSGPWILTLPGLQPGQYTFSAVATDFSGLCTTSSPVSVTVYVGTNPPTIGLAGITNGSAIQVATNGTTNITFTATASDSDGEVTNVSFFENNTLVASESTPPYSLTASNLGPGSYTFTAVATDDDNLSTTSAPISFVVFVDSGPPEVAIYAPVDATMITAPTNIIGDANSLLLQSYQLEYRLKNPDDAPPNPWTVFASGTSPVVSNTLGVLDPTLMLNGMYEMQLVATDVKNRTTETAIQTFSVERNLKIGNFTVSFVDLNVPVSGIPIQIVRTYDSRDQRSNDFGIGWSLDIRNVSLQKTRSLGPNWYQSYVFDPVFPYYNMDPIQPREITVTMADDKVYHFQAVITPTQQYFAPIESVQMTFTNEAGTYGGLAIDGDNEADLDSDGIGYVNLINLNDFSDFNPTRFRFTNEVGDVYIIDENTGVQSETDLNQNTLVISTNGILWTNTASGSAGVGVAFVRDSEGRISQIIDPSSNVLNYVYGTNGSLAAFTDRTTNTTTFAYTNINFPNYLTGIMDPRGQQPVRTIYDDSGRMVQEIDANGNVISLNHDFGNNRDVIVDALGNTTIDYYDNDGNIVAKIDALGNTTTYQYDSVDNLLQKVDALGNTNSYTYDNQGNKLTETDPLGNTISYTYGPYKEQTSVTTARGYTTTNAYDSNSGMLTQTVDPLGNLTTFAYSGGNLTMKTDAQGNTMSYSYDSSGHVLSSVAQDAQGTVLTTRSYTYDANGNRLTQSVTRTTPQGPQTSITAYTYDQNNRLTQTIRPDGSTNQIVYALGLNEPATEVDGLGRRTVYSYDALGNLTNRVYSDLTQESYGYDADNRRISKTDRSGRTTFYTNDALGRVTATRMPDGSVSQTVYDAVGRTIATIDELGNSNRFEYDPHCGCSGRQTDVIDALGNDTHYTYDQDANQTSVTDPLGRVVTYVYDALDRRTQVTFADGTQTLTVYDQLGRRISQTDQNTNTTFYGYDGLGRMVAETNSSGEVMSFGYDEAGNLVSQTDASGRTTTSEFDAVGRRTERTLPLGQMETFQYDGAGNLTNHVDFNGHSTVYSYDAFNRLLTKTPDPAFAAPPVILSYTPTGKRASMSNTAATVTYLYNSRDWLTNKTVRWNLPSGARYAAVLSYTYDSYGNLTGVQSSDPNGTAVTYQYDPANRLSSVSTTQLGCCATYGYDAAGRIDSVAYPNGINNTCQYDAVNNLTNITALNSQAALVAEYAYTYSAVGRRLTAAENVATTNGVQTINRIYSYDANYRLTGESLAVSGPASLPGNSSIGYTYDNVGNRLSRVSTLSQIPAASYNYDVDDHLTSDTYDNNGNTVSGHVLANQAPVNDQYDFENRIVNRNNGEVTLAYDADGNRMSKTVNGVTTLYLVDDGKSSGYAQVLEEYTSVNSQTPVLNRVYTYGIRLIAQNQSIGGQWTPSFYGYDGHGNVRYLTDAAGHLTDTYDYDAFGKLIAQSSIFSTPTPNSYLFAGEQFDADLGLYYNRARYLNTDSGRFWTRDPLLNQTIQVLRFPSYEYTLNDPVNQADRSGELLDEELIAMEIGAEMDWNMSKRNIAILVEYGRVLEHKTKPAAEKMDVALDAIAAGGSDWAFAAYEQANDDFATSLQEITWIYIKEAWSTLEEAWSTEVERADDEMEDAFNNTGDDTPQTYYTASDAWPCCGPSYNAPGLPNHDPELDSPAYQDIVVELFEDYYKLGHLDDDSDEVDQTVDDVNKDYEMWKEFQKENQ